MVILGVVGSVIVAAEGARNTILLLNEQRLLTQPSSDFFPQGRLDGTATPHRSHREEAVWGVASSLEMERDPMVTQVEKMDARRPRRRHSSRNSHWIGDLVWRTRPLISLAQQRYGQVKEVRESYRPMTWRYCQLDYVLAVELGMTFD
jgi:hypothetical protein